MIHIEKVDVYGFDAAIRGMRNPMNSWDKSDSGLKVMNPGYVEFGFAPNYEYIVGPNDLKLMQNLVKAGTDHSKFMRYITVTCDITAPLYWWKEYDTYKVGTVANSCSTMHKIHEKKFTMDDFSCELLSIPAKSQLQEKLKFLEKRRVEFNKTGDMRCWHDIIQLLPSSYNQRRTVQINYAVLRNMYHARKEHKLYEWRDFCKFVEALPYAKELIVIGD